MHVEHVGVFGHERDERGRLFFPRCESTRTDCRARADHVAIMLEIGQPARSARLCRHHAEELAE